MVDEIPKDITDPERAGSVKPLAGSGEEGIGQKPAGDFASHMKPNEAQQAATQQAKDPSPVQLQKASQAASTTPSMQAIQGQINTTSSSLGDVKNQLHTKGLKLNHGQKQATRDKLGEANENIRSANKHLGAQTGQPIDFKHAKNPIAKYLTLVSDGQDQLASATQMINTLGKKKGSVNPAKMLLVQVKLAKAQQALDYTSTLLGKALEFLKTTMQTQI